MIRRILLFTQKFDTHADQLCSELTRLGAYPFRVDAEQVSQLDVGFSSGELQLSRADLSAAATDFDAVFVRRRPSADDFGISSRSHDVDIDQFILMQKEFMMQELFFRLHVTSRMYNSLDANNRFMGKLNQDPVARRVGLDVPRTIVSSEKNIIGKFVAEIRDEGKRICSKPLVSKNVIINGEAYTRYTELLPENFDVENEDFSCPLIMQEYIEKRYEVRATVIDHKILAVRIDSQEAPGGTQVDWRKYNLPRTPHSIYKLPDEVQEKLLRFHEIAGLRFSAFDLARSEQGNYVFLETNPMGQWLWLENLTGLRITREIATCLKS